MDSKLFQRLVENGHEPHPARGTFTLHQFKTSLQPHHEITVSGVPFYSHRLGRNVCVKDLLPERVALCVDDFGEIISDEMFKNRWLLYQQAFGTGKNVSDEPCPNPVRFVMRVLDPLKLGEDRIGYIDVRAPEDTRDPKTPDALKNPDGSINEEARAKLHGIAPAKSETEARLVMRMFEQGKIDSATKDEMLAELFGSKPEATETPKPEPATPARESVAVTSEPEMTAAPCGKTVKARGVAQHITHCKSAICTEQRRRRDEQKEN